MWGWFDTLAGNGILYENYKLIYSGFYEEGTKYMDPNKERT